MASIRKTIINFFFLYGVFTFAGFSSQFEIYFFSVGQANFSILKTSTHALVVDCGTKRMSEKSETVSIHAKMQRTVKDILKGIKPTILISHMDDDHYCGLNEFFPMKKRCRVIVGGIPAEVKNLPADLLGSDVFFAENKQNGKVKELKAKADNNGFECKDSDISLSALINSIFGKTADEPVVQCLLPSVSRSRDRNDQSIVVKITYKDKSILLTGDASDALLENIKAANLDCFKNIDVMLFSHHGSNEHGELELLKKIENDLNKPILGIISSKVKGASYIPKYFPDYRDKDCSGETFLQKIQNCLTLSPITLPISSNSFCAYHTLSMYDKSIENVYAAPAISEDGKSIIPVFCTGDLDTLDLFYKITICSSNSNLTMTNQTGTILYQTIGNVGDVNKTVFSIAKTTKDAFQKKIEAANTLTSEVNSLSTALQSSFITSESIGQEINSLATIAQSGYFAKITILDRLLKVMNAVISNFPHLPLKEKFKSLTTMELSATELPATPFMTKWIEFLWENNFFVTDSVPINSLANLLIAYLDISHSGTSFTSSSASHSFSSSSLLSNYTQDDILKKFDFCRDHLHGRKRTFGEEISSQLNLSNNDFLSWVDEKVKSILGAKNETDDNE